MVDQVVGHRVIAAEKRHAVSRAIRNRTVLQNVSAAVKDNAGISIVDAENTGTCGVVRGDRQRREVRNILGVDSVDNVIRAGGIRVDGARKNVDVLDCHTRLAA